MKARALLCFLPVAGILASGCMQVHEAKHDAIRTIVTGHPGGAYLPQDATRFDYENHERVVLLDRGTWRTVTVSRLQERILEDGRLEVVANVRNRRERRIEVRINCVFKDEQGFSTGDETPFHTLILRENAQESVKFIAMNDRARDYTIRIGPAR